MADSSGSSVPEEKQEPVNLLYLATQARTDCDEVKLHEQSSSQGSSLEVSPSGGADSGVSNTATGSPVTILEEKSQSQKSSRGDSPDKSPPVVQPKRPPDSFRARQLSTHALEEKDIHLTCPRVNCPEKIVSEYFQ